MLIGFIIWLLGVWVISYLVALNKADEFFTTIEKKCFKWEEVPNKAAIAAWPIFILFCVVCSAINIINYVVFVFPTKFVKKD